MLQWWRIFRLTNALISSLAVLAAGWLAVRDFFFPGWYWAVLGTMLIGAAANASNDLIDIEIDRINRPRRPLPSGGLNPRTVRVAVWLTSIAGVIASALFGWPSLIVAVAAWLLLMTYNRWLKLRPLSGNVAVALVTATLFGYVGSVIGGWAGLIPAALFTFGLHLAREIVKDLEDREGDAALGARTLALVAPRTAKSVAFLSLLLAIAVGILVRPWAGWGEHAGLPLIAGVIVLYGVPLVMLLFARGRASWSRLSLILKLAMPLGLLLLVATRW